MSRFPEYDGDEEFPGQWELYQANLRRAFKGKHGQRFLRELREALMALPEHKLIEGALCTVGAPQRRAAMVELEISEHQLAIQRADEYKQQHGHAVYPDAPYFVEVSDFDKHVERDGEGVCAAGAYLWHQKVKAGMDPESAFAELPLLLGTEGDQGATTNLLADEARVAHCIAWDIASRNDETYCRETPEQRWQAFVDWIGKQLTDPPTT